MKKYSFLLLALMSVLAFSWTGCTDSIEYDPVGAVEGQGVFFPKATVSAYKVKTQSGDIKLNVGRTYSKGAFDAPLTATVSDGADQLFTVPSSVAFADGENTSTLTINYSNLVPDKKYEIALNFADGTPYADSSLKVYVQFSQGDKYEWEVVSKNAVYTDNLFSPFQAKNIQMKSIVVEKAKGLQLFRFLSPYDNSYFKYLFDMTIFPKDFEFPYIVLDGETYKEHGLWYIKAMNLGFQMINGVGPKFDAETAIFGSVAGNLKTSAGPIPPTSEEYPLGTFDPNTKKFDFGAVFHDIGGHGIVILEGFTLYLDPSLMEPNFDTDYTWAPVDGGEGQFVSEIAGEAILTTVEQAEEDKTFFRLTNVYSEGGHIYFNINDEGMVTLPKDQNTGLKTYNNEIYMQGTPGKSTFDSKKNILNLGITFYLVDENGKKTAELASGIEKFYWGGDETVELQRGKKIDDYVGVWKVPVNQDGEIVVGQIGISKVSADKLAIVNLSFTGGQLEDVAFMDYDAKSGLLMLSPQQTGTFQGFPVYLSFFDPTQGYVSYDNKETFIAGFIDASKLQFFNDPSNSSRWPNMMYIAKVGSQIQSLTGLFNYLTWTKAQTDKSASISLAPRMQSLPTVPMRDLNIKLYKGSKKSIKLTAPVSNDFILE